MSPTPSIQKIPLKEIIGSDQFRLSFNRSIDSLKRSIAGIGQAAPVFCRKRSKGFELFSGFLRREAMLELRQKTALAMVWPENAMSQIAAFRISFFENAATRGLNLIEQSMAVNHLKRFGLSAEEIALDYFQKAGFPANAAVVESLSLLARLEDDWKKFLAEKQVNLRSAAALIRTSARDRKALSFLPQLGATSSQFREALEMADEISKANRTTIQKFLNQPSLRSILQSKKLPRQKLDLLISALKKMRRPGYDRLLSRHQNLLRKMGIPAEAVFEPADYFEGPEFKLELLLKSSTNARDILQKLAKAAQSPDWEKLFEFDDED